MTPEPGGRPEVVVIVAVARNGVIGNGPDIPWSLPEDQARFKRLTLGRVLIMGRKTYASIGRPLPRRTTIVVTRDPSWGADGVEVASDVETALVRAAQIDPAGPVWVAGGGEIYAAALPHTDRVEATEVDTEPAGDAYFPPLPEDEWRETAREAHQGYSFVTYLRAEGGTRTLTPEGTGT